MVETNTLNFFFVEPSATATTNSNKSNTKKWPVRLLDSMKCFLDLIPLWGDIFHPMSLLQS